MLDLKKNIAVFLITKTINESIAFTFETRFRIDAMKKKHCIMSLNKAPNALSHIRKPMKRTKVRCETTELNIMCCDFVGGLLRQIHKVKLKLKHTNKRRDAHNHIHGTIGTSVYIYIIHVVVIEAIASMNTEQYARTGLRLRYTYNTNIHTSKWAAQR